MRRGFPLGTGIGSSNARFQPRSGTCPPIMRHALAAVEAAIFLSRPIALVLARLKIGLGVLRQKSAPSRLEIGARLVERGRGAALMFSGMGSRIKPAAPGPRGDGNVSQPHGESKRKVVKRLVVGSLRSFEIMASVATEGSCPTSGGNQRPDGVANQNAGKKNARQIESWWRHLHLMRPLQGHGQTD